MDKMERELRGKRVLVTGAAGFIGSRLVKELLEYDAEVVALVDEKADLTRIEPLLANPKLYLTCCSLTDIHSLFMQRQKWGDVNLIAHLGVSVPESKNYFEQCINDITMNLLPTINLFKILGDSIQGICFASSVSVYGNPTHLPVKESDLPSPNTSYGATKLAIENYLSAYGKANNVPVTILRYAVVYGPGEYGHRAIPNFLHSIARGLPPIIYGDGSEIRDYVYVDDVVRATLTALARKPARILNIGSGRGYSVLHIAQEVISLCSAIVEPEFLPVEGHNINIVCDISAAREALSYFPPTSLEEGLTKEIEWCRYRYSPRY